MNKDKIKVSGCIITRNDDKFIKDCILHIYPFLDEIIILDSNDDNMTMDIIKNIPDSEKKLIVIHKPGESKNFSELRNEVQSMASGDYVLFIDTDERWSIDFLTNIKKIVKSYLDIGILPIMFRLPRHNEPDKINYPDYQVRLLNRKYTEWVGNVHEVPEIINLPRKKDFRIFNLITLKYDIIHLFKEKDNIQIRWKGLLVNDQIKNTRKLMFCYMFRNDQKWVEEIFGCMYELYEYNRKSENRLNLNFSFLDCNSTDGTFDVLNKHFIEGNILNIQLRRNIFSRSYLIEQSVSGIGFKDEDYILFCDGNIKFSDSLIHELIKDMELSGAHIIAPMIFVENFREFGNTYFYDIFNFRSLKGEKFSHFSPYLNDIDIKKPNQVESVGSFFIMKYKVAKLIKYNGDINLEHIIFCREAREKMFKIFVSHRLSVLHINFDKYNIPWG